MSRREGRDTPQSFLSGSLSPRERAELSGYLGRESPKPTYEYRSELQQHQQHTSITTSHTHQEISQSQDYHQESAHYSSVNQTHSDNYDMSTSHHNLYQSVLPTSHPQPAPPLPPSGHNNGGGAASNYPPNTSDIYDYNECGCGNIPVPDCIKEIIQNRYNNWHKFKEYNDKFAKYIERVRFLQAQTAVIKHYSKVIADCEDKFVTTINSEWNDFLGKRKHFIDNERRRRPDLAREEENLKENLRDIVGKYQTELDKYNRIIGSRNGEMRTLAEIKAEVETLKMQIADRQHHINFLRRQVDSVKAQLQDYRQRLDAEKLNNTNYRERAHSLINTIDHAIDKYIHLLREELPHIIDEITMKYRHEFRDKLHNEIANLRHSFEKALKSREVKWVWWTVERKELLIKELDKLKAYTRQRIAEIRDIERITTDLPALIEREATRNLELAHQVDNKINRVTLQRNIFEEHWRIRASYISKTKSEGLDLIEEMKKLCKEYERVDEELEKYRRLIDENHISVHIISQPSSRGTSPPGPVTPPPNPPTYQIGQGVHPPYHEPPGRDRVETETSHSSEIREYKATIRFRIRRRGKVTFTRPVGDHYITIENRDNCEVNISYWRIEIVNGRYKREFVFPQGTSLKPEQKVPVRICSCEENDTPYSFEFSEIDKFSLQEGAQYTLFANDGKPISWQTVEKIDRS